jgi:hypothetical protein
VHVNGSKCTAMIFVNPAMGLRRLNFEAINRSTFTYLGLNGVTLSPEAPFTQVRVNWNSNLSNVLIRVWILGNPGGPIAAAWVDDLAVRCS